MEGYAVQVGGDQGLDRIRPGGGRRVAGAAVPAEPAGDPPDVDVHGEGTPAEAEGEDAAGDLESDSGEGEEEGLALGVRPGAQGL